MTTILLHNPFDVDSQFLVAEAMKDDPTILVINWYDERDREKYLKMGGIMEISALPSIVTLPTKGKMTSKDVLRSPESWATAKLSVKEKK